MKYANIKLADVGNGPGVRITLFVSGCSHACPGCFNYEAQDYNFGKDFTKETIDDIINLMRPKHIQGLTLLGGEPMDPVNQGGLSKLIKRVREEFGYTKDIWMWTGYTYPTSFNKVAKTEFTDDILNNIDVLVDGRWVIELYDIRLKWRGSANQRVINMRETLEEGKISLVPLDEPIDDIWETIMRKRDRK